MQLGEISNRYRLSSGTDEEIQLISLVGIFVKLRGMMNYNCLFSIFGIACSLFQSFNQPQLWRMHLEIPFMSVFSSIYAGGFPI